MLLLTEENATEGKILNERGQYMDNVKEMIAALNNMAEHLFDEADKGKIIYESNFDYLGEDAIDENHS